ncbi:unnamed protein product [Miscanthus lutarioriparius]|uniref:Zinc finger ZPR1-type domain-containing protein n=1 Tax=Miscanthus lutarioriparius TaxID=422564 RepID=A0A811SIG7_9POAL|nr:unnamed protein product [Miscanthus lutarioriparius]
MASSGDEGRVVVDLRSAAESAAADEEAHATPLHEIESLCMRCGENGITRLLLTLIPHFREVVLMAFECPHCGERNNEIQFAGQLQPKGCCYSLEVPSGQSEILNRQVVKSDSATIKIPELDFEIPPEAQRGHAFYFPFKMFYFAASLLILYLVNQVEGIIMRAVDELQALQDERKLRSLGSGEAAFTFVLDDPAGNSFIENPHAPSSDPLLSVRFYERTREQQAALGFLAEPPTEQPGEAVLPASAVESNSDGLQSVPHGSVGAVAARRAIAQGNPTKLLQPCVDIAAPEELKLETSTENFSFFGVKVLTLNSHQPPGEGAMVGYLGGLFDSVDFESYIYARVIIFLICGLPRLFLRFYHCWSIQIWYFTFELEVIVMATTCDMCGYRNSELKPGGEIPAKGKKITLRVQNARDLTRDVIKSDSASVKVPELELELSCGTLGGMVTTVEGLIVKICEALERIHRFQLGDSTLEWKKKKWEDFKERLSKLLSLQEAWTLIIDDGLAASFVAPATDSLEDDSQLTMEEYQRSWEQNEELGLNDMDTSSADAAYNTTST